MMFRLRSHNTRYAAIFDVHSGSVGIALVYYENETTAPQILYSYREEIKILEKPDTERLVRAVRQALFAATLQFSQNGVRALKAHDSGAEIGRVVCICGAPWAQTATRFIQVADKTPFTITKEKVASLIAEAERRDEEELKTSSLLRELELTLVERAVVDTTVNGYPIRDPYGKRGTEMTLAHISGLIPHAITEALNDAQDKILHGVITTTHTFALALFCVVRDRFPETAHAILMDISAEATEICIMQNNVLLESHVFPYGTNTFVRDLARRLGTIPPEALTHLKEYGSQETPKDIRAAIEEITDIYSEYVTGAFQSLEERYVIPKNFYLTTSKGLGSFFDPMINNITKKYTTTHGTCVSLNNLLEKEHMVRDEKDAFFALEAYFFHKRHTCGEIA